MLIENVIKLRLQVDSSGLECDDWGFALKYPSLFHMCVRMTKVAQKYPTKCVQTEKSIARIMESVKTHMHISIDDLLTDFGAENSGNGLIF